jgi:2,6-dihydroxypseudooxynicotine hydrolase
MSPKNEISYPKMISEGNLRYRFVAQGLDLKVVEDAFGSVKAQEDWVPTWMKVGDMFRQMAEEALAAGHSLSAGDFFMKATWAYHWAQFFHFHDLDVKQKAQLAKVNAYAQARPLVTPPIQRIETSFEGVSIPIDVRIPLGRGPHPAVILICGTDSTKEENFVMGNSFLARGLAVVGFDGPGQGEVWPHMKLRPDFHKVVSLVADTICELPAIAKNRLVLLGKSFGGFLAPSAAAHDIRFKACAGNGGYFDTSFFDWNDTLRAVRFQFITGAKSLAETKEKAKEYTLAACIRDLKIPLLIVHGGRDKGIPASAAKRIADEAAGPSTFIEFPEGIHCTHNIAYKVTPMTVDWLADHAKKD